MNLKALWQSKNSRIALIVGAGLLVAVAAFVTAGAVDGEPGWVPAPLAGILGTAQVADGSLDGAATGKAQAPGAATPVSSGGATSGDDGSASGDSTGTGAGGSTTGESGTAPGTGASTQPTTTPPAGETPGEPAAKTMSLRILLWNDTSAKPVKSLSVAVGATTWSPADASVKSAVGSLAGLAFDTKLTLVVMPDGASGKRIEVPITFTPDMISNSEGDAVHVEIKDATVRVLGTPVDNFDVTQDRF